MNKLSYNQRMFLEYIISKPEYKTHSRIDGILASNGYVDNDKLYLNLIRECFKPIYKKQGVLNKLDFIKNHLVNKSFSVQNTHTSTRYYITVTTDNRIQITWRAPYHNSSIKSCTSYCIDDVLGYLIQNVWDFNEI